MVSGPFRALQVASSREDAWIETIYLPIFHNRNHVASSREDAWIETVVGADWSDAM